MIRTRQLRQAAAVLLLTASLFPCGLAWGYARDKTDIVMLRNGDRLSGDILSVEFGILSLSTDNMSTLSIEWPAVRSVTSKFEFAIERRGGSRYHGVITTSDDGADLIVQSAQGTVRFPMGEVERDPGRQRELQFQLSLDYPGRLAGIQRQQYQGLFRKDDRAGSAHERSSVS